MENLKKKLQLIYSEISENDKEYNRLLNLEGSAFTSLVDFRKYRSSIQSMMLHPSNRKTILEIISESTRTNGFIRLATGNFSVLNRNPDNHESGDQIPFRIYIRLEVSEENSAMTFKDGMPNVWYIDYN